jgi:hypothetical protein
MSQTLELPDDVYEALAKVAREGGLTPAEWLATKLHTSGVVTQERPLADLLNGLTGVIDSRSEAE